MSNWTAEDFSIKFWTGRDGTYDTRGQNARSAKLTDEQVREIKRAPNDGPDRVPHAELGRRYGVGAHAIRRIRDGITWTHIKIDEEN